MDKEVAGITGFDGLGRDSTCVNMGDSIQLTRGHCDYLRFESFLGRLRAHRRVSGVVIEVNKQDAARFCHGYQDAGGALRDEVHRQ